MISDILEGRQPPLHRVMAVRRALQATADVYKPLATDLAQRMAEADNMDVSCSSACMDLTPDGCMLWQGRGVRGCSQGSATVHHVACGIGTGGLAGRAPGHPLRPLKSLREGRSR